MSTAFDQLRNWFRDQIGTPHPFQERSWKYIRDGSSGLIHVPTGAGKTHAAYLPALKDAIPGKPRGSRILYIAPLKAMTRDLSKALREPIDDLGLDVCVETRTGDTKSSVRRKQRSSLPNVLLTTPESLNLLLTYADAESKFTGLKHIIVDEWHELISSKRGTQTELALARLRRWLPELQIWGLTATLSNTDEAAQSLVGPSAEYELVSSKLDRPIEVESALPEEPTAFPWAGHLGLQMAPTVLERIERNDTTLVFTNTRSQAESWYQELLDLEPDLAGRIGLHHGSIDQKQRSFIEDALDQGEMKVVVSTSSLDLGVDFSPVDQIVQVGSVKGVSRLIQRAGRSEHKPGRTCRIYCVPTNNLQLFEFAAVRRAIESFDLEPRRPLDQPLDVLVQHFVTCATGDGFDPLNTYREITDTVSYQDLTPETYHRTLKLAEHGGDTLDHYEFYQRLTRYPDNHLETAGRRVERQHRVSIGTITSDPQVEVRYTNNHRLGSVEERFIGKLNKGDRFAFAGKLVKLVKLRDLTAYVKKVDGTPDKVPAWLGGRLPISRSLSQALRSLFSDVSGGDRVSRELETLAPIISKQLALSDFPDNETIPAEVLDSDEGTHLFIYPLAGRLVHEGLATLLAYRLSRSREVTFSLSANEYGLELVSPEPFDYRSHWSDNLLAQSNLSSDIEDAVNESELAERQFRSVARVAGLVFEGYPGSRKTTKQLQTSSSLLYKTFSEYDPDNPLLEQARKEAMQRYFQRDRFVDTLRRLQNQAIHFYTLAQPSPLGFPLMVERISTQLSSESLRTRIERLKKQWTEG